MPAGNHGSCIHHLELDICFDENNYHDSPKARVIEAIDICTTSEGTHSVIHVCPAGYIDNFS